MIKFVVKSARPWSVAGHVKGVDINRTLPMTYVQARDHLDMITAPRDPFYEALRYSFHWIEPCPPEPAPSRLEWEDVMGQEPETRTITQETLAMLDRYIVDQAPCPMDPIARTQEAVSRLVQSGHVSSEADTGWMDYMADMYPEYDQEDYWPGDWVQTIASGYEFVCPECDMRNNIDTWTEIVQCHGCCTTFRAYGPDHALG